VRQLEAELGRPVLSLSAVTGKGLPDLVQRIQQALADLQQTPTT
jgi:Fe2+ transport system protein B